MKYVEICYVSSALKPLPMDDDAKGYIEFDGMVIARKVYVPCGQDLFFATNVIVVETLNKSIECRNISLPWKICRDCRKELQ